MHTLVTGRSGTGKSTICHELQRQKYTAFDGDEVPGLACWIDTRTAEKTIVDYTQPIDREIYKWQWHEATLQALLSQHTDMFLCGSSDNDLDNFNKFDTVFVLDIPPEIQRTRIVNRMEHDYGKLPAMQDIILSEQQEFVAAASRLGAIVINATLRPSEIIKTILGRIA